MFKNSKFTSERGTFKQIIHAALYRSTDIKDLLLGDTSEMSASMIQSEFKKRVISHLYIDETVLKTNTYVFYDVVFPYIHTNTKDCQIIMYVLCHVNTIDEYYDDNYAGNKVDVLTQMIEDVLLNDEDVANNFGIGQLKLDSEELYQASHFYGTVLTFSVPNFRWNNKQKIGQANIAYEN